MKYCESKYCVNAAKFMFAVGVGLLSACGGSGGGAVQQDGTVPSDANVALESEKKPSIPSKSLVAPTIELSSPANGASFDEGTEILIQAKAADADGAIARVDFYSDGVLLGSDTSAPYDFKFVGSLGGHAIHAVALDNDDLSAATNVNAITVVQVVTDNSAVVTYPATSDVSAKFKSTRFAVSLTQNGTTKNSFVYEEDNTAKPGWSGTLDYMQAANHWTTFSLEGGVVVQARRLDGQSIQSCVVRPLSLGIKPQIVDNKCNFKLTGPAKVSVEIDEDYQVTRQFKNIGVITKQIVKHPLFIFAEPMEVDPPSMSGPGVVYFEPGIHVVGKGYKIPNNTQVYIAGGAYVIGNFVSEQTSPRNIAIRGRGILSGYGLTESSAEQAAWGNHAIDFSKGSKGSGLLIEGITITEPLRSCIISYNPVDIRNVKLFSWEHRNDGIVAGNNSVIEDNFIKVTDDNLKLYYSNQTIRRNVVWQQTAGAVFKFAWNLGGIAQNNRVTDIDVIHSDVFNDYAGSESDRADMHSTSAIFSSMGFRSGAAFQNNTFDNIRIEEKNILRFMSLRMVSTHVLPTGETTIWGDPDPESSKLIYNLKFNNIQLAGMPYKQSTLYGNAGGVIKDVVFSNFKINNNKVNGMSLFGSQLDSVGILAAGNVSNIRFE